MVYRMLAIPEAVVSGRHQLIFAMDLLLLKRDSFWKVGKYCPKYEARD